MTATKTTARKNHHPFRWILLGIAAFAILGIVNVAIGIAHDPSKKPLHISDSEAAGNCIGELQLRYKPDGVFIVGQTSDFTVTSKSDLSMELTGKVTSVEPGTGGTIKTVACNVARGHDGSTQTTVSLG